MKKTKQDKAPTVPNLFRDEEGSVMTEFLIVSPFLFTVIFGVMFYMDLNRFTISAQQHAYMQTWGSVAQGRTNLSVSDELSFTDYQYAGGMITPGALIGDMRTSMMVYPPTQGGDVRAGLIYAMNNIEDLGSGLTATPFQIQGMPRNTFDTREFSLGEVGGSGDVTYQNSTYLTPLWGAANAFVGNREQGDAYINITEVTIPARHSIMNDPYSVYWHNKGKRLRYVDRFTLMRDPIYGTTGIVQTMISGNLGIVSDLPTILDDLGYSSLSDALSWLDNPITEFIGSILDFAEQAQPMRKVDKRMDQDHDVGLKADYGKEEIPSNLKLQNKNSDRWEAIQ